MDLAILEGDAQNITIYELVPDLRGGSFVVGYHVPRGVGWWRGWDGGERWGVPDICNTCRGVVHAYHTMVGPSEWDEQIGPSCGSVVHAYYYRCLEPSTFSPHPILPTIPLLVRYDNQQQRNLLRDLGPLHRQQCSEHCLLTRLSPLPLPYSFSLHFRLIYILISMIMPHITSCHHVNAFASA